MAAPDGRFGTLYSRITRTHVIITAFIVLGLLSFSLLITAIVQAHNRGQNTNTNTDTVIDKNGSCLTQGCISAANYQLRSIDSTASSSICTDFYKYACGGWKQTHFMQSNDVERTIIGDILNRRDADIERLLDAPIPQSNPQSWEYKLKTYYSECIDDYARILDSGKYMIGVLQDPQTIDGWFLFDNSAANASQTSLLKNQSYYTQLSHIHGDFGVTVLFGIRTKFDETDPSVKRLEFHPAGLTMEINDYVGNDDIAQGRQAAYQLYITDVVGILAREAKITDENLTDRAFTIANDAFTIEKLLAESLQRHPTDNKPVVTNLQNMSQAFSFDFAALMGHELADPNVINILTPVYITNQMYFQDVFGTILANEDPIYLRMVHNYLRWRLLSTYIEDLSYNYVHAHRIFLSAYYGYSLHTTNEAFCAREVIRRFPLAIQRLYTMNSVGHSTLTTVRNIFLALRDGLKQYINEHATWMEDESTKRYAREKIDALTESIGYAHIASDDTLLNNYYAEFEVTDDSHFLNAINYHRFHRWSLSTSLANAGILDHWDLFETRTSRLFDYIASFNRLFVVGSGMHEPLVDSQWPWPMNMGSLGVLLAQKLFASIDGPEGRTHLANGTRFDWWASPTVLGYNKSRDCITNYYVNDLKHVDYDINGALIRVRLAGEPFSSTTLRHIGALRFAYNALMKDDEMKAFKMPGTYYTSAQTFFLAYAQTQCYQRDGLFEVVRTQLGTYDEQIALNTALIHMPEFAQAFQCTPKQDKCFD
ncbi:unnamed protein product [Adineta steineri]|uniref:Uncharacterized protein n=1 Tax=Adineta steineri TaxID=433720 RepID=A0A818TVH0_9BILA|nr:unnamed protein product [Adineta steineri]CAF3692016.1 unnamed protein product [Adineta steineri]